MADLQLLCYTLLFYYVGDVMNHPLDGAFSNQSEIHWQLEMAAREHSKRYDLWLERCYMRYFGWNKRAPKMRHVIKRPHKRVWTNQARWGYDTRAV